jgi:S1-C subfamily serine protease
VTQVVPGSPSAKAGLAVGDELAAAGGRRLFGQADFRGVLHRGPKSAGTIELWWMRGGKAMSGTLELADGWRKTDLGWRTSIAGGNIGGNPGFWPVPLTAGDRKKLSIPDGTMAVHPYGVSPEAKAAGLTQPSIVTAVDDQRSDISGRPWLIWFRMNHEPGDTITVTFRDSGGAEKRATYRIPMKSGE